MFIEAQYWFCCGGRGSFQMIGSELGGVGQKGQERCWYPSQLEINKDEIKTEAPLLLCAAAMTWSTHI